MVNSQWLKANIQMIQIKSLRDCVGFYFVGISSVLVVEHHRHEEHEELFGFVLLGGHKYACT
jgi:hypothetical protein